METKNFEKLIQGITGRDFQVNTKDVLLQPDTEYIIFRILPITKNNIVFKFKTPKNPEKILRTFVTTFTTKYREPDPSTYDYTYGDKKYTWEELTEKEKEYCYLHHVSHMYNKKELLDIIHNNLTKENITELFSKYGFYSTLYGIGIFLVFAGVRELEAIKLMHQYLLEKNIPFKTEFSDAKWVFRFKLELTKQIHNDILLNFEQTIKS